MRMRLLLLAVGLLCAAPALAQEATDVTVETSRGLYVPGDTVEVIITNRRTSPVWLPGCAALQVQVFESDRYEHVPLAKCVAEGEAVKVEPGTHVLSFTAEPGHSGRILRAGVAIGWGCKNDGPLSGARCQDFVSRWSRNFRVSRKGDAKK